MTILDRPNVTMDSRNIHVEEMGQTRLPWSDAVAWYVQQIVANHIHGIAACTVKQRTQQPTELVHQRVLAVQSCQDPASVNFCCPVQHVIMSNKSLNRQTNVPIPSSDIGDSQRNKS